MPKIMCRNSHKRPYEITGTTSQKVNVTVYFFERYNIGTLLVQKDQRRKYVLPFCGQLDAKLSNNGFSINLVSVHF